MAHRSDAAGATTKLSACLALQLGRVHLPLVFNPGSLASGGMAVIFLTKRRSAAKRSSHLSSCQYSKPTCCSFLMRVAMMRVAMMRWLRQGSRPAARSKLRHVCTPLVVDPRAQQQVVGELTGHPGVAVFLDEAPERRELLQADVLQRLDARRTDAPGGTGLLACLALQVASPCTHTADGGPRWPR